MNHTHTDIYTHTQKLLVKNNYQYMSIHTFTHTEKNNCK